MQAFLFAPVVLAVLGLAAWVTVFVVRRYRDGRPRHVPGATYQAARALGATGPDPDRHGAGLTVVLDGRRFSLVAGEWSKHGPLELLLGTDARRAEGAADASVFRQPPSAAGPLSSLPAIVFRREVGLDRWGKRLGLNRELQASDAAFDGAVYVEHEGDATSAQAVLAAPGVRTAVGAALASAPAVVTNTHEQAIALRWRADGAPATPEQLGDAMARLAAVARELPPVASLALRRRPSIAVWRLALGLVVAAVTGSVIVTPAILDHAAPVDAVFLRHAAALSGAIVIVALLAGWLLSRGRPRGLARFGVIALATLAAAPALALGGLVLANGASVTARHTVEAGVVSTKRVLRRKRGERCSVELSPWREGLVAGPKAPLPCGALSAVAVGDRVTLSLARGRLGYEWIDGATPAP